LVSSALVVGALCGAATAGLGRSALAQGVAAPVKALGTPAPALLSAPTRLAAQSPETLPQSIERRRAFPFRPNCEVNTQQLVACLWQRRDQLDGRLLELLGGSRELEGWRSVRHGVCRRPAERGRGGSIGSLLWFSCENALNTTLLQQLTPGVGP
jgi:hypothetical protein